MNTNITVPAICILSTTTNQQKMGLTVLLVQRNQTYLAANKDTLSCRWSLIPKEGSEAPPFQLQNKARLNTKMEFLIWKDYVKISRKQNGSEKTRRAKYSSFLRRDRCKDGREVILVTKVSPLKDGCHRSKKTMLQINWWIDGVTHQKNKQQPPKKTKLCTKSQTTNGRISNTYSRNRRKN